MVDKKTEKHRKTPRQIAEERLGVAERLVKNLTGKRDSADRMLREAMMQLAEATRRRDYLAQDPALPHEELVEAEIVDETYASPCPECAQGKHQNCTHEVPDPMATEDSDLMVPCPCEARRHVAA